MIFISSGLINITLLSYFTGISISKLVAKNEVLAVLVVAIPVAIVYILDLKNKSDSRVVEDLDALLQMQSNVKERYESLVNDLNQSIKIANSDDEDLIITSSSDSEKRYDVLKSFRYFGKEIDNIITIEKKLNKFNKQGVYSTVVDPERFINMFRHLNEKAWSKTDDLKYIGPTIPIMFKHYEKFGLKDKEETIKSENLEVLDLIDTYFNIDFSYNPINFFIRDNNLDRDIENKKFIDCSIKITNFDDFREVINGILIENNSEDTEQIMTINNRIFKNIEFQNCNIKYGENYTVKLQTLNGNKLHLSQNEVQILLKDKKLDVIINDNKIERNIKSDNNFSDASMQLEETIHTSNSIVININDENDVRHKLTETISKDVIIANNNNNSLDYRQEVNGTLNKNNIIEIENNKINNISSYKDIRENISLDRYNPNIYELILEESEIGSKPSEIKNFFKEKFVNERNLSSESLVILYSRDYSDMPSLNGKYEFSGWHSFFANENAIKEKEYLFITAKKCSEEEEFEKKIKYYCIYFSSDIIQSFLKSKNISKTNKYNFYFSKFKN